MTMNINNLQQFVYDEVTSTFDVAKQLLQNHSQGVVIAKRQTKGKVTDEEENIRNVRSE